MNVQRSQSCEWDGQLASPSGTPPGTPDSRPWDAEAACQYLHQPPSSSDHIAHEGSRPQLLASLEAAVAQTPPQRTQRSRSHTETRIPPNEIPTPNLPLTMARGRDMYEYLIQRLNTWITSRQLQDDLHVRNVVQIIRGLNERLTAETHPCTIVKSPSQSDEGGYSYCLVRKEFAHIGQAP